MSANPESFDLQAAAYEVVLSHREVVREDRPTLDRAERVAWAMRPFLPDDGRERVAVALLDVRHRLLGVQVVSVGSLTASIVHPREVFRPAVLMAAAAVVLAHSHPSQDPTPSFEDHQVTARVREAGRVLGIPLVDHVIVAGPEFHSFRDHGQLGDK